MRRKRILIVEDDHDLRRLFRTVLTLEGYDVEDAGDGVEALRLVENRTPDLIVLDLVLRALDVACVLRKPVLPDDRVRTVRHCLASAGPAAGV